MNENLPPRKVSRRRFLAVGGGAMALAAGMTIIGPETILAYSNPSDVRNAGLPPNTQTINLTATDGWIYLPGSLAPDASGRIVFPDPLGPKDANNNLLQNVYIFGFREVPAGVDPLSLKGQAQASAPLLITDEGRSVTINLTNAGLQVRPDLVDSHTVHWHGFRNAIPLFDGVPEMSIAVPIGRDFTYYYEPQDPGTYMYHCHFEDVEHVHMGMTGVIFVRPKQNTTGNSSGAPIARYAGGAASAPLGYAYNDGVALNNPLSTAYDREWSIFLSEVWAKAHYDDAHIQVSDWSDFHSDFWLMNGRCYPDTLEVGSDPNVTPANPKLQYQPISSLIKAKEGEKVLLRIVSLGYTQSAMTVPGIDLRVVGKDAVYMKSKVDNTSTSYLTNTVYIGAGEATDVIFTAPAFSGISGGTSGNGYDTYLLYNRDYSNSTSGSAAGYGGQMTEIRIYPANTSATILPAQSQPNT